MDDQQQRIGNIAIVYEAPINVQRLVLCDVDNLIEMENNSQKSIVYITINTKNNKIYVGVHITEDPYKFDNYYGCGITGTSSYWFKHPKYPFQKACKKYGLDVFKRYTLYVFDTYEQALLKEREIVNEEFLKRSDVYNVSLGGGGGLVPSTEIEVHQYDLKGNFICSYKSYSDAGRKNKISYMSIISAVKSRGICCNSYWSETKVSKLNIDTYIKSNKKAVFLYNHTGKLYKEFPSISDCAKFLEVNVSGVQKALRNNTKCAGYFVSETKCDKLEIKKYTRNTNKPVYQYDKQGNYLREFISLEEVRIFFNRPMKRLAAHIADASFYEGFYWSYQKVSKLDLKTSREKQIEQYDLNGNLIKTWKSYRECVKEFSNLRYVLNGTRASTKGYKFKYVS